MSEAAKKGPVRLVYEYLVEYLGTNLQLLEGYYGNLKATFGGMDTSAICPKNVREKKRGATAHLSETKIAMDRIGWAGFTNQLYLWG